MPFFVYKYFISRRCLMYFQWAYPKAKIMICLIEIQRINKESWFKNSTDIKRVMGIDAIPGYYLK